MNMDTRKYPNFQSTVNQISNQTNFFLSSFQSDKVHYSFVLCVPPETRSHVVQIDLQLSVAKVELELLVLQLISTLLSAVIRAFHHHARFYAALETKFRVL